jgi:hypothetical protein
MPASGDKIRRLRQAPPAEDPHPCQVQIRPGLGGRASSRCAATADEGDVYAHCMRKYVGIAMALEELEGGEDRGSNGRRILAGRRTGGVELRQVCFGLVWRISQSRRLLSVAPRVPVSQDTKKASYLHRKARGGEEGRRERVTKMGRAAEGSKEEMYYGSLCD